MCVFVCSFVLIYFGLYAGHIDHSARVMRVITWNRSFRGLSNIDDTKDDFDSDENETHATVLDKLLAWEKKLYDEVKVCFTLFWHICCTLCLSTRCLSR